MLLKSRVLAEKRDFLLSTDKARTAAFVQKKSAFERSFSEGYYSSMSLEFLKYSDTHHTAQSATKT